MALNHREEQVDGHSKFEANQVYITSSKDIWLYNTTLSQKGWW